VGLTRPSPRDPIGWHVGCSPSGSRPCSPRGRTVDHLGDEALASFVGTADASLSRAFTRTARSNASHITRLVIGPGANLLSMRILDAAIPQLGSRPRDRRGRDPR